jgi:hypothetical protein
MKEAGIGALRLTWSLLLGWAIAVLPTVALSASREVLKVDTRFGPVIVVASAEDCCKGTIQFHDQKLDVVSAGEIYAANEGLFQVVEGDLLVLSVPTGARGMPPDYHVILVNASNLVDITDKNFTSADGTFKAQQRGNEIVFDLGFESRKPKSAFYRSGVLYVGSNSVKAPATLARDDCAYVLNTLAACRKSCPSDGFMSMAVMRNFTALEEKPVFKADTFFKICAEGCKGRPVSTSAARQQLCGY